LRGLPEEVDGGFAEDVDCIVFLFDAMALELEVNTRKTFKCQDSQSLALDQIWDNSVLRASEL
jgi:hypothetical protein